MKKLMFGAAIAATSMVFAAEPKAQVYDVKLSIKSTAAYTATINNKGNPIAVQDDQSYDVIYRKQASYTWQGLIWGCNCETIDGVWEMADVCEGAVASDTVKGCIIWDSKSKQVRYMGNDTDLSDITSVPNNGFGWTFLQMIGKDGKTAECVWNLVQDGELCGDPAELFNFVGAGFGTAKLVTVKDDDGLYGVQCTSYLSKLSGNFAGYRYKPSIDVTENWGCTFCGTEVTACVFAETIWDWCKDFSDVCNCDADLPTDTEHTAAYGTWTISYNSSLSSKLSKKTSIIDAYGFSEKKLPNVYKAIAAAEEAVKGKTPTEECEALENAMNAAKTALDGANDLLDEYEADVEFLSDEAAVKAVYTNAHEHCQKAVEADIAAMQDLNMSNNVYTAAYNDYTNATMMATGSVWTVDYTANGNTFSETVTNCVAFDEKVGALVKDYAKITNVVYIADSGAKTIYTDYNEALKQSAALQNAVKNTTDALNTAEDGVKVAKAAKKLTEEAEAKAREAEEAAETTLDNRTVLLAAAESKVASQKVIVSSCESDYEVKKAAYLAAGCND